MFWGLRIMRRGRLFADGGLDTMALVPDLLSEWGT